MPSGLRELQPSPPLFQQTPPLQVLKRKPIHLSLKKLTFGDGFSVSFLDGLRARSGVLEVSIPRSSAVPSWPSGRQLVRVRRRDKLVFQGYASVRLGNALDLVLQMAVRARRQHAHDGVDARRGSRLEKPSLKLH